MLWLIPESNGMTTIIIYKISIVPYTFSSISSCHELTKCGAVESKAMLFAAEFETNKEKPGRTAEE